MQRRIRFDYVPKDRMLMQRKFGASTPVLIIADVAGRLALGIWVGSLAGFAVIFAPTLFQTVSDPSEAGAVVARSLAALTMLGYVAGVLTLVCAGLSLPGRREIVRIVLVALMIACSWYGANIIAPHMNAIVASAGGKIAALPKGDPRLAEWNSYHERSIGVFTIETVLGLVALSLAGRRRPD